MSKFDDVGVFQDKKSLSAGIIQMEFNLISEYQDMIRRVRIGELDRNYVGDDQNYNVCWQMLAVLYKFLQNKFLDKLKAKSKKEYEELVRIMENYETEEAVTFEEFKRVFNCVIKTMSLNNFDDVFFKTEEEDDFA